MISSPDHGQSIVRLSLGTAGFIVATCSGNQHTLFLLVRVPALVIFAEVDILV